MTHLRLATRLGRMLRLAITLAAFLVVGSGMSLMVLAQEATDTQTDDYRIDTYTNRFALIPYTQTTPSLDGTLSDDVWHNAWFADGFLTMFHNAITPTDTQLYMMYDDTYLYVGMRGSYADPSSLPQVERVDLLLSPGKDAPTYRIELPISVSGKDVSANWGESVTNVSPQRRQLRKHKDHWTMELAIALSSVGARAVEPGDEWSFNVMRYFGVNSEPFSSYIPIRHSYIADTGGSRVSMVVHALNQNRMAPLYFSRLPALGADRELQPVDDPSITLNYVGLTTKELSIAADVIGTSDEVSFTWLSPDGQEVPLPAPGIIRTDDKTTVTIEHPRPQATGLYRLRASFPKERDAYGYFELTFDRTALIEAGERAAAPVVSTRSKREVPYRPASSRVEALMELIPENTGFIFTGLPEDPTLRPYQLFDWNPSQPWQMRAKATGTVYPNEKYPEDRVLTAVNPLGQTVEYPYYEGPDGKRYFFTAHIWYLQRNYALQETQRLASVDPLGTARLLNRWAEVYEGYIPTNDYYWTNYLLQSGPPYHYWGGLWSRWYTSDMANLKYLLDAFTTVSYTNAFDLLSEELGYDVEQRIIEKVFKPSIDFVRSFPVLNHNMEFNTWRGLISMAKASRDPSYMHLAVELIETYAQNHYLFDGFWKEVTLSYHNQSTTGLMRAIEEARGWTDPEGYISPRTGRTLHRLDLSETFPALKAAQSMGNLVSYPNGSYVAMQDTWANARSSTPMTSRGSFLLPASGIARLSSTEGPPTQLYLMFTPKYGHNHYDPLNITLFAHNQELLPDIGYTHTFFRRWSTSTLAHNTVVVNGQDMTVSGKGQHGGHIEALMTTESTAKMVKASYPAAYPMTDEYSREVWLVQFGGENQGSYVIDLFRIDGGHRHEYTLSGDINRDAEFTTPLATESYNDRLLPKGTQVRMPTSESDTGSAGGHYYAYLYIQDVERAEVPDGKVDLTLVTRAVNGTNLFSRLGITTFVESGNNELFIGKAPSLRMTRLFGVSQDLNSEAVKYTMPKMVLRRSGIDLQSTFVTVMEPYPANRDRTITHIERLTPDDAPTGFAGVKVTYGPYTDYLLSMSDPEHIVHVDGITLQGKGGFVRIQDEEIVEMILVGGTLLQTGDTVVTGSGPLAGPVTDVQRRADGAPHNALVTSAGLRDDYDYEGHYVIVTHPDGSKHGYPIKDVQIDEDKTIILLDTEEVGWHLLPDGTARMAFHPFTSWTGEHRFHIDHVEVLPIADENR